MSQGTQQIFFGVLVLWVTLLTIQLHHVKRNAWNRWQQTHSFAVHTRRLVEQQTKYAVDTRVVVVRNHPHD